MNLIQRCCCAWQATCEIHHTIDFVKMEWYVPLKMDREQKLSINEYLNTRYPGEIPHPAKCRTLNYFNLNFKNLYFY